MTNFRIGQRVVITVDGELNDGTPVRKGDEAVIEAFPHTPCLCTLCGRVGHDVAVNFSRGVAVVCACSIKPLDDMFAEGVLSKVKEEIEEEEFVEAREHQRAMALKFTDLIWDQPV